VNIFSVYDGPVPMSDLDAPGGYGMLDMGPPGFDDQSMMHMAMQMQQHPRSMAQNHPQRMGQPGPHHMMQDPMAPSGHPHMSIPHDQMTGWFDPDM